MGFFRAVQVGAIAKLGAGQQDRFQIGSHTNVWP
jgi:hypothetical protein